MKPEKKLAVLLRVWEGSEMQGFESAEEMGTRAAHGGRALPGIWVSELFKYMGK